MKGLMEDTSPEIKKKMIEMIQLKTPSERCEMGCSMIETSKHLILCSILNEQPNITQNELRVELFLKFCRDDFNLEQKEQIVKHLLNAKVDNTKDWLYSRAHPSDLLIHPDRPV